MKLLIKCENISFGDGRSFAFSDVAEIAEKDAKILLKTKQAVETKLPLTVDAKGNELEPVSAGMSDGETSRTASNQKR